MDNKPKNGQRITDDERERIWAAYRAGKSRVELQEMFGRAEMTISRVVRERGVPTRKRMLDVLEDNGGMTEEGFRDLQKMAWKNIIDMLYLGECPGDIQVSKMIITSDVKLLGKKVDGTVRKAKAEHEEAAAAFGAGQ